MVEYITMGLSALGAVLAYKAMRGAQAAKRCAMAAESRGMQARDAAESAEEQVRTLRGEVRMALAKLPKSHSKKAAKTEQAK